MSEVFQDVNPLDYVMAEEDDPECPKDIEIPYDDAEAVSGKTQDGELMHNVKCSSSLFFGKRALQVRLPNFKFKAKHLDQDGRLPHQVQEHGRDRKVEGRAKHPAAAKCTVGVAGHSRWKVSLYNQV